MKKTQIGARIPIFWGEDMDWGGYNRKRVAKRRARSWRRGMNKVICRKALSGYNI